MRTCERYDISADKWTQLPENCAFDEFIRNVSVVTTSSRYIHVMGGLTINFECPDKEIIRTYDSLKPFARWRVLSLVTTRPSSGGAYGLINLD